MGYVNNAINPAWFKTDEEFDSFLITLQSLNDLEAYLYRLWDGHVARSVCLEAAGGWFAFCRFAHV